MVLMGGEKGGKELGGFGGFGGGGRGLANRFEKG